MEFGLRTRWCRFAQPHGQITANPAGFGEVKPLDLLRYNFPPTTPQKPACVPLQKMNLIKNVKCAPSPGSEPGREHLNATSFNFAATIGHFRFF